MSDRDRDDEESTEELWDDIEEFADGDSGDIEAFSGPGSNGVEDGPDPDPGPQETGSSDPVVRNELDEREPTSVDDGLSSAEDTPEAEEVFDEMNVSAVDGEALWDELADSETDAESFDGDDAIAVDADAGESIGAEPVDTGAVGPSVDPEPTTDRPTDGSTGDTETLVDKRAYCQQCPYFSEPPEVSCGHDGTEIVEVLEDGRFRVRGCPVVTETGPDRTILNKRH